MLYSGRQRSRTGVGTLIRNLPLTLSMLGFSIGLADERQALVLRIGRASKTAFELSAQSGEQVERRGDPRAGQGGLGLDGTSIRACSPRRGTNNAAATVCQSVGDEVRRPAYVGHRRLGQRPSFDGASERRRGAERLFEVPFTGSDARPRYCRRLMSRCAAADGGFLAEDVGETVLLQALSDGQFHQAPLLLDMHQSRQAAQTFADPQAQNPSCDEE